MGFWNWYVSRGRITRRTWWLYYSLPLFVLALLAWVADVQLGQVQLTTAVDGGFFTSPDYGPVSQLMALLTVVPGISSTVTRLHDRGHSGWWLLFALIPVAGTVFLLVQTGFLAGEQHTNWYGPVPPPGSAGSYPDDPESPRDPLQHRAPDHLPPDWR